jgi:hypothetical protein
MALQVDYEQDVTAMEAEAPVQEEASPAPLAEPQPQKEAKRPREEANAAAAEAIPPEETAAVPRGASQEPGGGGGGGGGRKRQPISFNKSEVEQRVATKRAAREAAEKEVAAAGKTAEPAAADAATQPPAAVADAAPAAAADADAGAAPDGEPSAAAAAAAEPAAPPPARAPKLQRLDVGGRKAPGGAAASAVTAALPSPLMQPPPAPPSTPQPAVAGSPSRALRIDGFVRPFTEPQVRRLGDCSSMLAGLVADLSADSRPLQTRWSGALPGHQPPRGIVWTTRVRSRGSPRLCSCRTPATCCRTVAAHAGVVRRGGGHVDAVHQEVLPGGVRRAA